MKHVIAGLILLLMVSAFPTDAQTNFFTYQGSLKDGANSANGSYDFEFRVYDAAANGNAIGGLITVTNRAVTDGVFSVDLFFLQGTFDGSDRYIEVRVRPAGIGAYITLGPRQRVNSVPYALKSLTAATATNAAQLGGVPANQYVTTVGGVLSGNIVNADTQYNIGGSRFARITGTENTFVGIESGGSNTPGEGNSFFGYRAGNAPGSGMSNSYFGRRAGASASGDQNASFGEEAGAFSTGFYNTFIGQGAGFSVDGSHHTLIGWHTGVGPGVTRGTAIGSGAFVTESNSVVLGRNTGDDTVRIPGRLYAMGNLAIGVAESPLTTGTNNLYIANNGGEAENVLRLDGSNNNFFMIARSNAGAATGAGIVFRTSNAGGGETTRMTINPGGTVEVNTLGAAGSTSLCRNSNLEISTCTTGNFSDQDALVKEMRAQIEIQKTEINLLKKKVAVVDELKKLVCGNDQSASVCKENK